MRRLALALLTLFAPGLAHAACPAPYVHTYSGSLVGANRLVITQAGSHDFSHATVRWGFTHADIGYEPILLRPGSGASICIYGLQVIGEQPTSVPWVCMKYGNLCPSSSNFDHDGTGLAGHSGDVLASDLPYHSIVDSAAVVNVQDGLRWTGNRYPHDLTVRDSAILYNRDDSVELDVGPNFIETGSYIESYLIWSNRPGKHYNGGGEFPTWNISDTMAYVKQLPGPTDNNDSPYKCTPQPTCGAPSSVGGTFAGAAGFWFFKIQGPDGGAYPTVHLKNVILRADAPSRNGPDSMVWPQGTYENVTLIYPHPETCQTGWPVVPGTGKCLPLADGANKDYLRHLPAGVTLTANTAIWDNARTAWIAAHPFVAGRAGMGPVDPNIPPTEVPDTYSNVVYAVQADYNVLANDFAGSAPTDVTSGSISTACTHGSGSFLSNGKFRFTPTNLYVGDATCGYKFSNSVGQGNEAIITFHVVAPAAQPPVALADFYNALAGTTIELPVTDNDQPGTYPLSTAAGRIRLMTSTADCTTAVNGNGNVDFLCPSNTSAIETFTYEVKDTNPVPVWSAPATVTVTVTTPLTTPTEVADTYSNVVYNVVADYDVLLNDIEGTSSTDVTSGIISQACTNGVGSFLASGKFRFTATNLFVGDAVCGYRFSNSAGQGNQALITFHVVAPASQPPVAFADAYAITGGALVELPVADNDQPGTYPLSTAADRIRLMSQTVDCTGAVNASGNVNLTCPDGINAVETFTYEIQDTNPVPVWSAPATVTVTLTKSNLPPPPPVNGCE